MAKQDCIVDITFNEEFESSTNDPMTNSGLSNLLTTSKKKPVTPTGAGGCCCTCSSCC